MPQELPPFKPTFQPKATAGPPSPPQEVWAVYSGVWELLDFGEAPKEGDVACQFVLNNVGRVQRVKVDLI